MVGTRDKWGVEASYATGEIKYDWNENFRSDGLRFDFNNLGSSRFVSAELIGYFACGNPPDDEVSGKMGGGRHTSGSRPKVYDMGIDCRNGNTRYRTEDYHPEYDEGDDGGKGVGMSSKYIGYKFVKWNKSNGVLLEIWQDTGNNESTPANAWKKLASWLVTDPKWFIPGSDHQETIRIDQVGTNNLKWKWLSLREIKTNDSDTGGGGTDGGSGCVVTATALNAAATNTVQDPLSLVNVVFKDGTKMSVRAFNDLADAQRQSMDANIDYIPFGTMIWEDSSISIRRGAEKPTPPPFPFTGIVDDFVTFKNGTTMRTVLWNELSDNERSDKTEDLKHIPFHHIIWEDSSIGIDDNENDPDSPPDYTGTVASYTKSINSNLVNPPTGGGGTNPPTGGTTVATKPSIPATPKTKGLKDYGGPKFNNATVYFIFSGSYWNTFQTSGNMGSKDDLTEYMKFLMAKSTYMDGLLQYGINRPKFGGAVVNTTKNLPTAWDTEDVVDVVKDSIQRGQVPNNTGRKQNVYVVLSPSGTNLEGIPNGASAGAHCVDPDVSNMLDGLIIFGLTHGNYGIITTLFTAELTEALTSPYGVYVFVRNNNYQNRGWEADPAVIPSGTISQYGSLIADLCEQQVNYVENSIPVTPYYSNQDGGCTDSNPRPTWLICPTNTKYNSLTQMCEPVTTGGGTGGTPDVTNTAKPVLAAPKTQVMIYGGGPVWSSAVCHFIFAGSGGTSWDNVSNPSMNQIVGEIEKLFESTYFDGCIQYTGCKRPKLGNVVINNSIAVPDTYYSPDMFKIVYDAIEKGQVPARDPNVRHMYYIITKPGKYNQYGVNGGGWHAYSCTNVNDPFGSSYVIGTAIHRGLDAMMGAISHEVVSMITNPCYFPITNGLPKKGWYADSTKVSIEYGEELPDICVLKPSDSEATARGYPNGAEIMPNGVFVGKWYSNMDGTCQASKISGKPTWLSCPTGSTWNNVSQDCILNETPSTGGGGTTAPPPAAAKDVFGTKMIYQSKTGGSSWASTSWNNKNARNIVPSNNDLRDPDDNVVCVADVGDADVTITGTGEAIFDGRSTRVSVMKQWQNVESTVYVKSNNQYYDNVGLRPKTDHYCVTCSPTNHDCFGGYISQINWLEDSIYVRKEETHNKGYSDRIGIKSIDVPVNAWIGLKSVCYTMDNGHVKMETFVDMTDGANGGTWVKTSEGVDNGTWKGTPFTGFCKGSAIRTNSVTEDDPDEYASYRFKKWTIREILPTGAVSGDPNSGGGTCEEEIDWDYGGEVGTIEEGVPINLIPFEEIDTVDPVTGEVLVIGWDSNFDGKVDAWDENGDGQIDAIDMNFDGIADTFDIDGDGRAESFDTDLDGIIDKTGGLGIGEGAGAGTGGGGLGTGTGSGGIGGGTNSPSPNSPPPIQYVTKQHPIIYAIDTINIDACSITLPDEESEPEEIFKVAGDNAYVETRNYRKIGMTLNANDSLLQDVKIRRIDVILKKGGKGATISGNIYCRIRTGVNDTVIEEFDTVVDSSMITGNEQTFTFEIKKPTHQMNKGETIFIEYPKGDSDVNSTIGGDPDNYIMVKISAKDVTDSVSTSLAVHDGNSLKKFPNNDLACSVWA